MFSPQTPWIREREATLCTWKFDYDRGYVSNMSVSLLNDFMCLSDRQLENYARMIKECGFTGIQVMDICAAWRASGSYETVHDRFKTLSKACRSIGLKFTLWCWAAEFSGHGFTEPLAVYQNRINGEPAYRDPDVLAVFNKYYDIYADLAPYCDRVIAHFFDPGNLSDTESIIYFLKLFRDKFRAKNPEIKIAVDTWGCPEGYPEALVAAGIGDIMLMELPFLPIWQAPGKRAGFREGVKKLGCGLGVWGWYTADMEIDQLASMTVNNRVLKHVFNTVRSQGDSVMTPSYWSETDSYHILNYFSLYAAGHLLINPDDDPDRLLYESALKLTGSPENANALASVLALIRDARSGDTWDTYWWSSGQYVLRHSDYKTVIPRAENALKTLEELAEKPEPKEEDAISFPLERKKLYRLMIPHILQIKQFAEFCRDLDKVRKEAAEAGELATAKATAEAAEKEPGDQKEKLQAMVDALSPEIPEYNTVAGLWGQPEARQAFLLCEEFCNANGLKPPERSAAVKFKFKRRFVDRLTVAQRGKSEKVVVTPAFYEGYLIGDKFADMIADELAGEGVLERDGAGGFFLSNWQEFCLDFN